QLLKPNQIDHYIIIYIKKLIFVFTNQVLTISVIIMALLVLKKRNLYFSNFQPVFQKVPARA
ncbi:hypothetical protein MXZ79_09635, partial [Streptococcus uberis]